MKRVSVFMDVEDPINPLADDAALDLARLFSEAGVRGSFCVTGEKCRTLLERGRQDVIDAYSPHCLGLHTDTHSQHPTVMELLAEPSWDEGCGLAFSTASRGFEAFTNAFGRSPVFWGGAGNTWSPEITDAIARLGIRAYSYALTSFPESPVHRFNGIFGLPQNLWISEPEWADDALAAEKSSEILSKVKRSRQPWLGVFVGHPTKLRHKDYWDTPYFSGRTPDVPEFVEPLPVEVFERSKKNLLKFLCRLKESVSVVGVDEVISLPWRSRKANAEELAYFESRTTEHIRGAIRWGVHRPGLDPENIVEKTMALKETAEICYL